MTTFNPNQHLMKLRGRGGEQDYLPVAARILWLRTDAPESHIDCDVVELTERRAVFRATVTRIREGTVDGRATGYGSETPDDFKDFIEKASTKAIGRALAALGYGTQFAGDEMSEGTEPDGSVNVVDAPGRTPPNRPDAPQGDKTAPPRNATPVPSGESHNDQRTMLMRQLHATAKERGLTHDELHAIAAGRGVASLKDMTTEQLGKYEGWLRQATPDALRKQLAAAGIDVTVPTPGTAMDDAEQERIGRLVDAELAAKAGGTAGADKWTQ
jgi:hypothetical protein